ncbi:serine/threonine-protein kinase [Nocardia sp. IFM 10818]
MEAPLRPGTVFAGYRIDRVLGSGGMGTVYLAAHPRLPRHDALKVLSARSDAEYRARFFRESELVAGLDHPNIVAVRDRGIEGEQPWLAMQFVHGGDAAALIRRNPGGIPAPAAVHIVTEAACGLDTAHRAGILHRDVKPANLMLEPVAAGPDRVYLTDFGIAKAAAGATVLTEAGAVLATVAYAAPEQLTGAAIDQRADVYALGCTLYELLTGGKPFPRPTLAAVMHAHLADPPPRVSDRNPGLAPAFDAVVARALAKDPGHRYASCGELAAAAAAALSGQTAPEQSPARPAARPRRRARAAVAIAAVAALAAASLLLVLNRNSGGAPAGPTVANAPTTPSASPVTWGNYGYVAQAFPALLPAGPTASGYQGVRCWAVDSELRQVDPATPLGATTRLTCRGNGNPLDQLAVVCNTDRSPATIGTIVDITVTGDEQWERPSGRGRLIWADTAQTPAEGFLQIQFDDPARNFCRLLVWGGASGQDLRDRWWPTAPL